MLQLLLSVLLPLLGCRPSPLAPRQLLSRLLAIVEPLEYWLQLVYVDADIDLGWIAYLLHRPPEPFLLNPSVFIGPVHMHSMDRESIGKRIVVERHRQSSGSVTDLQCWLFSCLNAGLLVGDSKSVFTIYTICVTSRPLRCVRVYSLLTGSQHFFVAYNCYNLMMSDFSTDPAFPIRTAKRLSNMGQRGNGGACQMPSFPHHYSLIIVYPYYIKSCDASATFTIENLMPKRNQTNGPNV